MKIEIDKSDIRNVKDLFAGIKNGEKKVRVKAINKTLSTVRTQSAARIGNDLNLKTARIKKDLTIEKANYSSIRGAVVCRSTPVGLYQFGAKQTPKGVTFKIRRKGRRVLLRHAFTGTPEKQRKAGTVHVFWREYKGPRKAVNKKINYAALPRRLRYDIERKTGPRIADFYADKRIFEPVSQQAAHLYQLNFDKILKDELRRLNIDG